MNKNRIKSFIEQGWLERRLKNERRRKNNNKYVKEWKAKNKEIIKSKLPLAACPDSPKNKM